jgi:hypothetical protein
MKKFKLLTATVAIILAFSIGCKKEGSNAILNERESGKVTAQQSTTLSPAMQQRLEALYAKIPADARAKVSGKAKVQLQFHPEYRDIIRKTLKLEESTCNDNTASSQWLDQQLADWNSTIINYVVTTAMLDLPTYDALIFENSSANQRFGSSGQYTQRLTKAFKDLKRFWNIDSENIVLAAMHGTMLTDRTRILRTYKAGFGLDDASANYYADFVLAIVDAYPQLRGGDHPIFTFNAFAQSSFSFPPYGVIPDKIIMGDGILDAFAAIGYADVAPQAILAHEFGHHIQFDLNLFGDEAGPEATRRTELMADAYSAYYLSHARGASMQWKRVQLFLNVFFNIGDCSFTSDGHHGTPTQRMAAAKWGYEVANEAQKQGHILTAQEFTRMFEAQLPRLIQQ